MNITLGDAPRIRLPSRGISCNPATGRSGPWRGAVFAAPRRIEPLPLRGPVGGGQFRFPGRGGPMCGKPRAARLPLALWSPAPRGVVPYWPGGTWSRSPHTRSPSN